MRIVTLGRIGAIGEGDEHLYEGSGYLLRFQIGSAEQLFGVQLPFLVDTLGIDIRQIMRLELLGDGYSGLRHVMCWISFEDTESDDKRPERLFEKLWAVPTGPTSRHFSLVYDVLRERLIEFLLVAPESFKAEILKSLACRLHTGHTKQLPYESQFAGFVYRVTHRAASPPSIAEWRNTLLYCSERLRRLFATDRLERLTFTAVPNTEQDYIVEADVMLPTKARSFPERSRLRFRKHSTKKVTSVQAVSFEVGRLEQKLKTKEKQALERFDALDSEARLRFWQRSLSVFFA